MSILFINKCQYNLSINVNILHCTQLSLDKLKTIQFILFSTHFINNLSATINKSFI